MKKSKQEILQDLEYRLQALTDVTNTDPGSVARTFIEVLMEEFYEFYTELDLTVTMGFVSSSNGRYLDMIGELLNCTRQPNEIDDDYRARIVNQVYVVAGANLTSIRLKALAVPGVRDILFKEYTHGAGSFSCYVIASDVNAPRSVVKAVENVVNETKAYGVYADVKTPVLIPVQLRVRLIFGNDVGVAEKATVRQNAAREIRNYIENLSLGETLIVNEITERIMALSAKLQDVDLYGMSVQGTGRYVSNVSIKWDERFVLEALETV